MGAGTALGRVRGLGSAKAGVDHWILQRATAIGNFVLVPWFVLSLALLPALDHATVVAWIGQPLVAIPLLLLIFSVFRHFSIGVKVLIEDYLHDEGSKLLAVLALHFYALAGGAAAAFSVVKIALGS